LTAQAVHFKAIDPSQANNFVDLVIDSAIKDSYEVGLSGQGDLVRASITYQGIYNAANSRSFVLVVGSNTEVVT